MFCFSVQSQNQAQSSVDVTANKNTRFQTPPQPPAYMATPAHQLAQQIPAQQPAQAPATEPKTEASTSGATPQPIDLGNGFVIVPISLANQFASQIAAMIYPRVAQAAQMTAINQLSQQAIAPPIQQQAPPARKKLSCINFEQRSNALMCM